jgi:sporulation protein YlmC with PRC-barrel domain
VSSAIKERISMKRLSNVFLSRVLGNRLYDEDSNTLGKILDLAVVNDEHLPRIAAVRLKKDDGIIYNIKWYTIDIYEQDNNNLHISCKQVSEYGENDLIYLSRDLLDKQIVDINGRKVVRVNDLRIAEINGVFKVNGYLSVTVT